MVRGQKMIAVLCWSFIIVFIIGFSFIAALLLTDPDLMAPIAAVSIIFIGTLATVLLILTMPV